MAVSLGIGGWYAFWLGVAAGTTLLAMSAYRWVSPRWLKWLLLASGVCVISRYVTMTLCATVPNPHLWWVLRRCWFATSVGLTFPGVVALDQLVRHPAMTPKKLLRWYSPFLAASATALLFGRITLSSDPIVGMSPHLVGWAATLLSIVHAVFVLGFLWVSVLLLKKVPSVPIRFAVLILMAAYVCLGVDGLLVAFHHGYFRPFLFSEILALVALWVAFDTAHHHPL